MRMGSFIMGGIVGAAAVVYFSRKNMMGINLSQMLMRSKNSMMDFASSSTNEKNNSATEQKKSDHNQIEHIIEKDPEAKKEFEKMFMSETMDLTNESPEQKSTH